LKREMNSVLNVKLTQTTVSSWYQIMRRGMANGVGMDISRSVEHIGDSDFFFARRCETAEDEGDSAVALGRLRGKAQAVIFPN